MASSSCTKPRLLDLFCGAGGATKGYQRAGFHVTGVDIKRQPHYCGDEFVLADALVYPLEGFDGIHASPPCQDHMKTPLPAAKAHGTGWMLAATRARLEAQSAPWVIENVPGAPMRADYRLFGYMFGLETDDFYLRRERWFEVSWDVPFSLEPLVARAKKYAIAVVGNGMPSWHRKREHFHDYRRFREICKEIMDIDWMGREELSQAIPPAYTEFIGKQLLAALEVAA